MWFKFGNRADVAPGGTPVRGVAGPGDSGLFPPHLYPPPGSVPVFLADKGASNAAGVLIPAGLKYKCREGWRTVVRVLEIFADPLTLASQLTWAVLVDGVPVKGLGAISVLPRTADSYSEVLDQWSFTVPEGRTLTVQITNGDGGTYNWLGAKLEGWTYPVGVTNGQ